MNPVICPKCQTVAQPGSKFCANCGTSLDTTLSVAKQAWIYFVSVTMPPFGLIWVFKYMGSTETQKQRVALIATVLTVVSILLTVWGTVSIMKVVQSQIASFNNMGL